MAILLTILIVSMFFTPFVNSDDFSTRVSNISASVDLFNFLHIWDRFRTVFIVIMWSAPEYH